MSGPDIRREADRGRLRLDWLDARLSFNFAGYRRPDREHFGALLVLNEDRVQPLAGFPMHPHEDLEILMMPLEGAIAHADSLGNHDLVHPDEVMRMSAGTGIHHSQMNPSGTQVDRHLQLWLRPRTSGRPPSVLKRRFDPAQRAGRWQLIASPDARAGSLPIDQHANVWRAGLAAGGPPLRGGSGPGRSLYLHVVGGQVTLRTAGLARDESLRGGDAVAWTQARPFELEAASDGAADVLLLDLPAD